MSAQLGVDYAGRDARGAPFRGAVYLKSLAFTIIAGHEDHFRRDFMSWLVDNWHVWEAFQAEADLIWRKGYRKWGARTIGEYLRRETAIRETPNEFGFKVNDHWWPDLARLYMLIHPDREGFFERRVSPLGRRVK